jgi:hypothetical protein
MNTLRCTPQTLLFISAASIGALATGCTGQLPNSFRFRQAEETFSNSQAINTKIDMLWVVDNSASMDPSQKSLRNGFSAFAQKYMKPNWDIQVAVITTDTYLANPRYAAYRTSANYPRWTNTWGQLRAGNHDGPMASSCSTSNPYFYYGYGQCNIRDSQVGAGITGINECLNPGAGQDSSVLCVNTVANDNIHSNNPLVKTPLPAGTDATLWTQKLVKDFMTNISTGAAGSGVERGLGSVLQFVQDNELNAQGTAPNHLFRPGSLRVVIFVTDEDDQTVDPAVNLAGNPSTGYAYDVSDVGDGGAGSCRTRTVPCPSGTCTQVPCTNNSNNLCANPDATHKSYTYTLSFCAPQPESTSLMAVPTIKSRMDTFFTNLDGTTGTDAANPNYFSVSVIPLSGESLTALHKNRGDEDVTALGAGHRRITSDRGDRYIAFDQAVGNGSFEMELIDPSNPDMTDFNPILDKIGRVIVGKKGTFTLARAPTGQEDLILIIKHVDGSSTTVAPSQYTISDKTLTITDLNVVLNFDSSDQISISYQPKTAF